MPSGCKQGEKVLETKKGGVCHFPEEGRRHHNFCHFLEAREEGAVTFRNEG